MSASRPSTPRELCEFLVRQLVDDGEAVSIEETIEEDGRVVLVVHCAPEDRGKVIGRDGRIARAMRTVVRAAGMRTQSRITIRVAE